MVTYQDLHSGNHRWHDAPPVDEELQVINNGWEEVSVFFRDEVPDRLSSCQWSALNMYLQATLNYKTI